MVNKSDWTREHLTGRFNNSDPRENHDSILNKHIRIGVEVQALCRKLEAENDSKKRILIQHEIWNLVENDANCSKAKPLKDEYEIK